MTLGSWIGCTPLLRPLRQSPTRDSVPVRVGFSVQVSPSQGFMFCCTIGLPCLWHSGLVWEVCYCFVVLIDRAVAVSICDLHLNAGHTSALRKTSSAGNTTLEDRFKGGSPRLAVDVAPSFANMFEKHGVLHADKNMSSAI